jgi:DNA excision repair protein ERCC-4
MHIIIDTREQTPWTFEGEHGITTSRAKLDAGDYSVAGLERRASIERKSVEDWTKTVLHDRARFYRELELLRAYDFRCVIVETGVREIMAGLYKSEARPSSVMGFVAEVTVAQSVPVYLAGSRAEAQALAASFLRMVEKKLAPKEHEHPR